MKGATIEQFIFWVAVSVVASLAADAVRKHVNG